MFESFKFIKFIIPAISFQTVRFFMMVSFSALFTLMGFMLECHLFFVLELYYNLMFICTGFLTYLNSLTYSEV